MRPRSPARWLSLGAAIALCLSAPPASADRTHPSVEEKAAARSAADQGSAALEAGRFAEALDLFKRAEAIVHAPTHVLMMARANVALGNLLAAEDEYLQITRDPLVKNGPPPFVAAAKTAENALVDLEARVPTVEVTVTPAGATGVAVTMDDKPLPPALVGIARPIDPGKHVFVATAQGLRSESRSVTVAERDRSKVELEMKPEAAAPVADASTPVSGQGSGTPLAFAAIGLGVVGLGLGTVFSILASSKRSDADALYATCNHCSPNSQLAHDVEALDGAADTRRAIAAASLIGGGVFAAGGIAYLVFAPKSQSAASPASGSGLRIRPIVGVRSFGVSGAF